MAAQKKRSVRVGKLIETPADSATLSPRAKRKTNLGYPLSGRVLLARTLLASLEIQQLSYREIEVMTLRFYGEALNKNSISAMARANTRNLSPYLLQKICPFIFKVSGADYAEDSSGFPIFEVFGLVKFETTPDDPIGQPIISERFIFSSADKDLLLQSLTVPVMPLKDSRITTFTRLTQLAMQTAP